MKNKTISLLLAILMCTALLSGCGKDKKKTASGKNSSVVSSEISDTESENQSSKSGKKDKSSSCSSKTQSVTSAKTSSIKNNFVTSSKAVTTSSGVKSYKNRVQLGIYHLSMRWCDYYGTDFESRKKQFKEVVEQKYFNTYFLHAQDTQYLLDEIKIIVDNGGTFWMTLWNYHSDGSNPQTVQSYTAALKKVIDMITKAGYRDYLMGMIFDEPMWNGQSNADFLTQCQIHYKTFGLRNFPVFATGEFSGIEGNLSVSGSKMGKLAPEAMKYVTDVGFDSYGVDVRDGARNGGQYAAWTKELGASVTTGKDYYIQYKNLLKSKMKHPVNYWYFPTAFEWKTWDGKPADEGFCLAHLKFMAEDALDEKYNGGIALYTYYRHKSHNTVAMSQLLDITDASGNALHFPEFEKWTFYSQYLRELCERFNSTKARLVDLGL